MTTGLRLLLVGLGRIDPAVEHAIVATGLDGSPATASIPTVLELDALDRSFAGPTPDATLLHGLGLSDASLRCAAIGRLREAWPSVPVLVVHAGSAFACASSAFDEGAADVVPAFGGHLAAAVLMRWRDALEGERRRHAESESRSGQERFRRIVDEIEEGIAVLAADGSLRFSNAAARAVLDLERLGPSITKIALCDDRGIFVPFPATPIGLVLARGGAERATLSLAGEEGRPRWLDIRVRALPAGIERGAALLVVSDVTRAREATARQEDLERQLRHTQRLHTLGEMAGGIAHDFNNILAPMQGYLDLVLRRLDGDERLKADLGQIGAGVTRARNLVRQIATFGGHGETERRRVDLAQEAAEALSLLRATLPSSIEIRHRQGRGKTDVRADATQVHQVVVNLVTNAARAMDGHGLLTVAVDAVEVGGEVPGRGDEIEPGAWVRLRVVDTGCGMTDAVAERIFEPYFTTRRGGKGSGLGLSVVHGIVQQHGGAIRLRTVVGKGSCFDVYLPAWRGAVAEAAPERIGDVRGVERVLLVDDEAAIVDMLQRSLTELGYDVDPVTSAPHAIARARQARGTYAVLVTDYTMPRMTGLDVAAEIREWQPDIRVIMMTGYGAGLDRGVLAAAGVDTLLLKPVSALDLAHAIRVALARPAAVERG